MTSPGVRNRTKGTAPAPKLPQSINPVPEDPQRFLGTARTEKGPPEASWRMRAKQAEAAARVSAIAIDVGVDSW